MMKYADAHTTYVDVVSNLI